MLANERQGNDRSGQHNSSNTRIMSNMAPTGAPRRRRESLLDAASALASLGGGSTPLLATDKRIQHSPYSEIGSPKKTVDDTNTLPTLPMSLSPRSDVPMTFPEKLMEVLDNDQVSDIITWLPHGKGFVIVKKRRFASEILPNYFKQAKFTSFTRKLNRWGFTRKTEGPETGAYYHENFQRGNHMLCIQMYCHTAPTTSSKGTSNTSFKISTTRSPGTASPRLSQGVHNANDGKHSSSTTCKSQQDHGYVDQSMVTFDLVLNRQRELLREAQTTERQENSTSFMIGGRSSRFDHVFDRQQRLLRTHDDNNCRRQEYVSQPYRQPQDFLQEKPDVTNLDLVAEAERLFRHRPTSSTRRHHQLIIESALNALKSTETSGSCSHKSSSPRLQTPLHSAMHAQLRRLKEHNRSVEFALKKEQYRPMLSQNDVARLHNQIGGRSVLSAEAVESQSNSLLSSSSGGSSPAMRASAA